MTAHAAQTSAQDACPEQLPNSRGDHAACILHLWQQVVPCSSLAQLASLGFQLRDISYYPPTRLCLLLTYAYNSKHRRVGFSFAEPDVCSCVGCGLHARVQAEYLPWLQAQNAAPDLSQLPDPSELFGKAKGAADDVSGKAKGAADQASGSAKGAAEQAKGSASGAASKVCAVACCWRCYCHGQ